MGSGGEGSVVVTSCLAKQLEELFRILGDQLGKLRIAGAELLQNRLEHLRLLLHYLAQLLKLRVMAEELEVPKALLLSRGNGGGGSGGRARSRAASTAVASAALLGGEIEQVHIPFIATSCRGLASRRGGLLEVGRNAL